MKKRIIIAAVILITSIGAILLFQNNKKTTPQETIQRLENSVNKNDIKGIINCLVPELQEEAEKLISKADGVVDAPIKLIINTIPFLSGILDLKVVPEVEIKVLEVEMGEDTAKVIVNINLVEKKFSIKAEISMIQIKKQWYIKTAKPIIF